MFRWHRFAFCKLAVFQSNGKPRADSSSLPCFHHFPWNRQFARSPRYDTCIARSLQAAIVDAVNLSLRERRKTSSFFRIDSMVGFGSPVSPAINMASSSLRACNKTPYGAAAIQHLLLIGDLHMACVLVPDALWNLIEPLLPIASSKPLGGRPRLADRACLAGVIFVLRSGIPWRMLPKALGCGSGMTCWRRLRDWQQDGIWDLIHFALLDYLSRDGQIDWSRAVIDSCSVRAVFGGG